MKKNTMSAMRIAVLMIGAATVFAGLIVRLYFLQIINADENKLQSGRARNYLKILKPTRGYILDRNNRPLAQNKITYTVKAEKQHIENVTAAILQVGSILDLSMKDINLHIAALQREGNISREIERSVSEEVKEKIELAEIPGITFADNYTRFYPEGPLASQVIGFTGSDNEGLAGLELTLNENLKGNEHPIVTDKDSRRRMLAEEDYTKISTRGLDYVLTIDSYIQYVAERELKKACEETAALQAHAVVLHPKSGDVLAMANYPGYDPNHFGDYSGEARKNRLLSNFFEPGSVIKPFIMCAALEQRAVSPQMMFYCEKGAYYFKGHTIRDDIHRFENLSVHDILVRSSNIGMVKIAQRLGKDADDYRGQATIIYKYLSLFGFKNTGEKTIDELHAESGGILHPPGEWWPANIGAVPFGQGIATNTLVLTAAYGALANRGVYVQPRIILGKRRPDGLFQPAKREKPLQILQSNRSAEQVVQMMIDVTEDPEGTGYKRVRVPGFHIAGKTGTAQIPDPVNGGYMRGERIASFAGFFPAEDPQAVIVVVVERPKKKRTGGQVAGPVFQKIAEELIAYWGLSPTDKSDPLFIAQINKEKKNETLPINQQNSFGVNRLMPISPIPSYSATNGIMPNLIGLPIREAYIQLALNGLHARFEGSGKVVNQPVPAGIPVPEGNNIGVIHCEPVLTDPEIQTTSEWVVKR